MYGHSPDPGRGVYLARRIVAAIVVVLLLVLVVPRAFQAFLGPEEETSSVEPEKSAPQEETIGETEAAPAVEGGTTGEEVSAVEEAAQGTYVAEAEAAEIQRDLQAPQGQGYIIGEVNQTAPAAVPSLGAIQPAVQSLPPRQPISSAEPPVVPEPILPAEPPVMAEPILPVEPPVVAGPA